jgi:hypothetical protein
MRFSSRSANVEEVLLISEVRLRNVQIGPYAGIDFGKSGVDDNAKGVAPSHRVELELCQFTKDLFHYVAPFSDHEQIAVSRYCLQQLATPILARVINL